MRPFPTGSPDDGRSKVSIATLGREPPAVVRYPEEHSGRARGRGLTAPRAGRVGPSYLEGDGPDQIQSNGLIIAMPSIPTMSGLPVPTCWACWSSAC